MSKTTYIDNCMVKGIARINIDCDTFDDGSALYCVWVEFEHSAYILQRDFKKLSTAKNFFGRLCKTLSLMEKVE